jgi:hypothetical protein
MKKVILIAVALVIAASFAVYAESAPRFNVASLRSLGMGGAGLAALDGDEGYLFNPANVTQLSPIDPISKRPFFEHSRKSQQWNFFDLTLGDNKNTQDILDIADKVNDAVGTAAQLRQLRAADGLRFGVQMNHRFTYHNQPNYAFGNILSAQGSGTVNSLIPQVEFDLLLDDMIFYTTGKKLQKKYYYKKYTADCYVGGTLKGISRHRFWDQGAWKGGQLWTNINDTTDNLRDKYEMKRTTFGLDVGGLWKFNDPRHTNMALTISDVTGTTFGDQLGRIDPAINIGFANHPWQRWHSKRIRDIIFAVDINDVFGDDGIFMNSAGGFEVYTAKNVAWRLGLHQGYPSYGFGWEVGPMLLEYAAYSNELSPRVGNIEEKRQDMKLSFTF